MALRVAAGLIVWHVPKRFPPRPHSSWMKETKRSSPFYDFKAKQKIKDYQVTVSLPPPATFSFWKIKSLNRLLYEKFSNAF